MGQLKDLKPARPPPRLKTFTEIHPPSVEKERVNGMDKYSMTSAKPGITTIFSDGENEDHPSSGRRAIKRERSQAPRRAVGQGHQPSQPRIKQEPSRNRQGSQHIYMQTPSASGARRSQVDEPLRRREAQGRPDPPSDSSSSSESSGSDSSDSSGSEDESDSSSGSSSSDGSSSEDEANASVYRPTTPTSSIGSSPPKTRRQNEAGVRGASTASRQSVQDEASIGSGHTPVDFYIEVPARRSQGRSELTGRPRSHASKTVAPTGAQVDRTAQSNRHRLDNSSPVVPGFMPINRGSPPPRNAPTEPRAMRTGEARPAGTPVRSAQRPTEVMIGPVSGPSSLPFRGPRLSKDNSQQKGEQRRGPARPGRIMQTVEQLPSELLSASSPPKNAPYSRDLRPATPGPSSRRTVPPVASPGIFVTPRAVSVMPDPTARDQDSPQSVSRPKGKRTFDEIGHADSNSKAAEWKRMMERIKSHEREMEQQRAQLEETKRLLAKQKTRIDNLEQRRGAEELIRDAAARTSIEEPDVAPLPNLAHRDVSPEPVPCPQAERREEQRRREMSQAEKRDKRQRRKSSRVARIRMQEQERARIEQERQEDLQLQLQLEQEQRREAERLQCAARRLEHNAQPAPAPRRPENLSAVQRRIQHDVFNRPLSGHNPRIPFDDDDRPYISEATGFLMRLPQALVLARLRRLIKGREFFDVAHPGSVHMGCWVVSTRVSCDLRMKLTDQGESHNFSFARLAARLWHDESIYNLVQHHVHQLKAGHTCHVDACMRPDHVVLESVREAGERRRCKREGWCRGHRTIHKDGTRQSRKPCIFPPQGVFLRK